LQARISAHLSLAETRERAADAIRGANERRRISEANLRNTLSSLTDAVIATDSEGNVTYVNPIAESLMGCKQLESIGKRIEDIYEVRTLQGETVKEYNIRRVLEIAGASTGISAPAEAASARAPLRPHADGRVVLLHARRDVAKLMITWMGMPASAMRVISS